MGKEKSKLVSEIVKYARAGIELDLKPGESTPKSVPDTYAVGRFYTEEGEPAIPGILRATQSSVLPSVGNPRHGETIP